MTARQIPPAMVAMSVATSGAVCARFAWLVTSTITW
jgi:hypothetical protein